MQLKLDFKAIPCSKRDISKILWPFGLYVYILHIMTEIHTSMIFLYRYIKLLNTKEQGYLKWLGMSHFFLRATSCLLIC